MSFAARICAAALLPLTLGGCIAVGGTSHAAPKPTLGQELVDLKRAVDCGAISADEYARLRSEAIHGSPRSSAQATSADCDS